MALEALKILGVFIAVVAAVLALFSVVYGVFRWVVHSILKGVRRERQPWLRGSIRWLVLGLFKRVFGSSDDSRFLLLSRSINLIE